MHIMCRQPSPRVGDLEVIISGRLSQLINSGGREAQVGIGVRVMAASGANHPAV